MPAFKSLEGRDYSITSFVVYNDQSYTYTSGSTSNPNQVSVDLGVAPPSNIFSDLLTGSIIPGFVNDSGRYAYPTFAATMQYFYQPSASVTEQTGLYPTASCYAVSIGSNAFGEAIKAGTFSIQVVGSGTATDDGAGKLYVGEDLVGNIFYDTGMAVILHDASAGVDSLSADGMSLVESGQAVISFSSTLTIYEHTTMCRMQPNEFNWTWNPSLLSGSFFDNSSGSADGRVYDAFASGSLVPYVTTVGLYNDQGEMMAVAKLAQAVPRIVGSQQTIVIKFDT